MINSGKEWDWMDNNKMTEEDIKYRQGRRKDQVEGHAIGAVSYTHLTLPTKRIV